LFEGSDPATSGLWETDGTAAGTSELAVAGAGSSGLFGGGIPADFTQLGTIVIFTADDAAGKTGLWRTDGTAAGTHEITVNGANSYGVRNAAYGQGGYAVIGMTAYFDGESAAGTYGLWSTQGTSAASVPVANASSSGLSPAELTSFDNGADILFAGADNSNIGEQLFLITEAGVSEIANPLPGKAFSVNQSDGFASLGNEVAFGASDSTDLAGALFVSNGTSGGTTRISPTTSSGLGIDPTFITSLGSIALFAGYGTKQTEDLWITGGTAASTADLAVAGANANGLLSGVEPDFTRLNTTQILFAGEDTAGIVGLWITNGTASGTYEISVTGAYSGGLFAVDGVSVPEPRFTLLNGRVLFYGLNAAGVEALWSTDGTSAGTTQIAVAGANANGVAPGDLTTVTLACFAAGTRIATEHGDVAVERLSVGDRVRTLSGRLAPVRWLGWRRVACRRHARPDTVRPVRVAAHAFGLGRPHRDVLLSPDHAVFVDGALTPIGRLVNGATVAQSSREVVVYWHVELDRHDILLAEGLPTESYLDTGNRGAFANGGPATHLHPDFALRAWDEAGCAPLVLEGPALVTARRKLLVQAAALGHAITTDPGLRILADGADLAAETDGVFWRARLPPTARDIRIVSRVWRPAHTSPGENDTRALGVAVSALWLNGRAMSLASPALGAGWHGPEPDWRWTNGDATLAPADASELAFTLAMTGRYWRDQGADGGQRRRHRSRRTSAA